MDEKLSNKERKKLKKLERSVKEALLLSGGDPSSGEQLSVDNIKRAFSDKDSSFTFSKKLQLMRNLRDPPKINLALNRLNGGRISSHNVAQLVHYVTFHHIDKPIWVSLRPNRGILQTVLFRVSCDRETVESNKVGTYIDDLFGSESFIRMQTEVWETKEFWTSLLNVTFSKFERMKRILGHADIFKEHIKSDLKHKVLVTLPQMIDFCYPLPSMSDETATNTSLPPIVPTKLKYGVIKDDSPFFAIDCEMCVTETGESELTRISVVDENYEVLLDTLVKPRNKIVDYLTKYSGVTKKMLKNVDVRIEDVQRALSHILPDDAVLVGHTLECDLNALRITHPYCVDISLCLNLSGKERQRSSLKTLAKIFLDLEIHDENGHCSVDDAVVTMRLLKYKLSHGARFGNVSVGWSFDDWARENGLTSSGARIRKDENLATDSDVIVEPQPKRRCLDVEAMARVCGKCGRPLSVACIVSKCACKTNDVKNCVMCCLNSVLPQASDEEPIMDWNNLFGMWSVSWSVPMLYHLQLSKGKSALYAIPGGIKDHTSNEYEVYVNTDEYSSLEDLAERVSTEVIAHSVVMMDVDATRLKLKESEKPLVAIDNALRKVISYASLNSLIIVVFSSPHESLCYLAVKTQNRKNLLETGES